MTDMQPGEIGPSAKDRGHWGPEHRLPPGLAIAVAKEPFTGPGAPCPWEAIDPLTRAMLIHQAQALLKDAIPALLAAGWTPPKN